MKISYEMQEILDEIYELESEAVAGLMIGTANELGNELIRLYYRCESNTSKQLIRRFLSRAGVVWLRKLLTADTRAIVSSKSEFASLDDYVNLLIAQDDTYTTQADCVLVSKRPVALG